MPIDLTCGSFVPQYCRFSISYVHSYDPLSSHTCTGIGYLGWAVCRSREYHPGLALLVVGNLKCYVWLPPCYHNAPLLLRRTRKAVLKLRVESVAPRYLPRFQHGSYQQRKNALQWNLCHIFGVSTVDVESSRANYSARCRHIQSIMNRNKGTKKKAVMYPLFIAIAIKAFPETLVWKCSQNRSEISMFYHWARNHCLAMKSDCIVVNVWNRCVVISR